MDCKTYILLFASLLGISYAVNVELTSEWQPGVGWEVVCKWSIDADDKLLYVNLHEGGRQFFRYNTTIYGSKFNTSFTAADKEIKYMCVETAYMGRKGRCVTTFTPLLDPYDVEFKCEASGDRLKYTYDSKTTILHAFEEPTTPELDVSMLRVDNSTVRAIMNCSSSGIPAPKLEWKVDGQVVPADHSITQWNMTSKSYDVWSIYKPTAPNDKVVEISCTSEVRDGKKINSKSKNYVLNGANQIGTSNIVLSVVVFLAVIRLWGST